MAYHHYNPQNTPQKNNQPTVRQPMNTKPPIQPANNTTQRQVPDRVPTQNHSNIPNRPGMQPSHSAQPRQSAKQNPPKQAPQSNLHSKARPVRRPVPPQKPVEKPKAKKKLPLGKGTKGLLHGILPSSVYNPDSKKIFGMFSAEDLLLVALIFLCAESDEEDNSMMILALLYILVSDYIELPDLSF